MSTPDLDSASDLTFRRLSLQAPRDYRTWLRAGTAATIIGYALAFISIQLEQPWSAQGHPRELYVIGAGLVAAWLERRGRLQTAAKILLTAIWIEMHLTLLTLGARAAIGGVFPAVLTGVILFLGVRAGRIVALSSLLTVPGSVLLGHVLRLGPGLHAGDLLYVVAVEASTLGVALLISLLMNTFDGVLSNAERDARRVRELIDGAPDAILAVNRAGLIDDCNPSAELLFGRSRRELIGASFEALGLRSSADGQSRRAVELSALQPSARELFVFAPGQTPERQVPLEAMARTVAGADGSRDALVVLRDLSARKLAEERTRSLERQLQHAQKLEALGKLAGGVAHDFNNLLMAVGGYAEVLSRHHDARVREIADGLFGLRQRAAGLTGHLLAFARKGMTQPRRMDLGRAVAEMPRLLRPLIDARITLEIAPEPAFIYADPAQIEQVLLNLALNARDAMPEGGLLRIACHSCTETRRVELRVSDTGHGMDDATRRAAFEPFFTTKPRSQGTGLGLALVHGIMEASGGSIALESAPGKGTCFTLSWNAATLEVAESATASV